MNGLAQTRQRKKALQEVIRAFSHSWSVRSVHFALGCILFLAAVLKGEQLATGPVAESGLLGTRWFLIGVTEFELGLGLWMLAGLHPCFTRRFALITFSLFACLALYKGVSGEESCGCFGNVPVSPWYALLLDVGAIAALWRAVPLQSVVATVKSSAHRLLIWGIVYFLIGFPGAVAAAMYAPANLVTDGEIIGESNFVLLNPESWIGQRLPLLRFIDVGADLAQGSWIVVLYRHDCPVCHELMPGYVRKARSRVVDLPVSLQCRHCGPHCATGADG